MLERRQLAEASFDELLQVLRQAVTLATTASSCGDAGVVVLDEGADEGRGRKRRRGDVDDDDEDGDDDEDEDEEVGVGLHPAKSQSTAGSMRRPPPTTTSHASPTHPATSHASSSSKQSPAPQGASSPSKHRKQNQKRQQQGQPHRVVTNHGGNVMVVSTTTASVKRGGMDDGDDDDYEDVDEVVLDATTPVTVVSSGPPEFGMEAAAATPNLSNIEGEVRDALRELARVSAMGSEHGRAMAESRARLASLTRDVGQRSEEVGRLERQMEEVRVRLERARREERAAMTEREDEAVRMRGLEAVDVERKRVHGSLLRPLLERVLQQLQESSSMTIRGR